MPAPLVLEVNARCWLRELSLRRRGAVGLGNVPAVEFNRWRALGFTHIWLMGVWTTGPRSRETFLRQHDTAARLDALFPGGWTEADVPGSPYAIAEYGVPDSLGGEPGLREFRAELHRRGMKLLLDFVPNHVGLDHPWLLEHPEFFVQSERAIPGTFLQPTRRGPRWIAHGKDPFFPPWQDTAQLDLRLPALRLALISQLRAVAERCDGVRCDMAMLALNDVFARNWAHLPCPAAAPETEFWTEALDAAPSGTLFLAEAYWDLEARLQLLGFDFTYDKRVTDFVVEHRPRDLQRHLLERGDAFVTRSAHFLENHDEPRIAPRLTLEEHRAAALLVLGLPGLRLLHEGQTGGARLGTPVQLARRPEERKEPAVEQIYQRLLTVVLDTAVGRGKARLLAPAPAAPGDETWKDVIAVQWQAEESGIELVLVNLAEHAAAFILPLPDGLRRTTKWRGHDRLGDERFEGTRDEANEGLLLVLPPHCGKLICVEAL